MLTELIFKSALFHSFAVWGWGKFKLGSHSDLYWTAAAVAVVKNQVETKANQLTTAAQTQKDNHKHRRGSAAKLFQDCIDCMWKKEEEPEFIF